MKTIDFNTNYIKNNKMLFIDIFFHIYVMWINLKLSFIIKILVF